MDGHGGVCRGRLSSDELCSIPDPAAPASNVTCSVLDSRIADPGRPHDACGRGSLGRGHRLVKSCARFPILRHLRLMSHAAAWTPESQFRKASRRVRPAVCGSWTPLMTSCARFPILRHLRLMSHAADWTPESQSPQGLTTRAAGGLWVVDTNGDELCSIPDPAAPAANVTCSGLDSRITVPSGLTTRAAGGLWVVDALAEPW